MGLWSPAPNVFCLSCLPVHRKIGSGAYLHDLAAVRMWTYQEKELCMNDLEMKAVQLALNALLSRIMVETIALMSDTTTVVV